MKNGIPKTVAYLRVSTNDQDVASQKLEIEGYAQARGLSVDSWIEVSMSATNGFKERKITELLAGLRKGDTLIISELSRLARSMRDAFNITGELFKKKVSTHIIKQNLVLRENDTTSTVMISAFSMAAQIEKELISQRTKNGLALAKARGVKLGNPNLKRDNEEWSAEADRFARSLDKTIKGYQRQGMTQRAIVAELNRTGLKTRRGKPWYLGALQLVLKRLDRKEGGKRC